VDKEVITQFINKRTEYHQFNHSQDCSITLTLSDEIISIFIYLHHYPVDVLIAAIFQIIESTQNNNCKKCLKWLYHELKDKLSMKTLEY
jgi:Helix-turn-helix of DDE superfamily endonuclease